MGLRRSIGRASACRPCASRSSPWEVPAVRRR